MMLQRFSCAVLAVAYVAVCVAQPPAFEVAAIRLSNDPPFMVTWPGLRHGLLTAAKVTLRSMVVVAYKMTEPRVFGPDWLENALLKERFQLAVHSETRDMPVYDLVVAKGGVKMALYRQLSGPSKIPSATVFQC